MSFDQSVQKISSTLQAMVTVIDISCHLASILTGAFLIGHKPHGGAASHHTCNLRQAAKAPVLSDATAAWLDCAPQVSSCRNLLLRIVHTHSPCQVLSLLWHTFHLAWLSVLAHLS
jgi:hypothetical protein